MTLADILTLRVDFRDPEAAARIAPTDKMWSQTHYDVLSVLATTAEHAVAACGGTGETRPLKQERRSARTTDCYLAVFAEMITVRG